MPGLCPWLTFFWFPLEYWFPGLLLQIIGLYSPFYIYLVFMYASNNFDWFHSVSKESFKGIGEIEYDTNISLISWNYVPCPRSTSLRCIKKQQWSDLLSYMETLNHQCYRPCKWHTCTTVAIGFLFVGQYDVVSFKKNEKVIMFNAHVHVNIFIQRQKKSKPTISYVL